MQLVGVRELKNRLTFYLDAAKNGDNVVVTDRGKPVAILHRLEDIEENAGLKSGWRRWQHKACSRFLGEQALSER